MRLLKLLLRLSLALLVLMALAVGAMAWWLSGDGPRMKAQDAASEALGVPVRIERVSLELKPLPALAVHGLRIQTKAALSVQKLSVRPAWAGLLHEPRQLELLALHLENASLPQAGIDQLQQSLNQKQSRAPKQPAAPQLVGLLTIPQRIVLEQVTWQSTTDDRLVVSGSIQLNNARELAQLDLKLAGGTVRGSIRMLGLQTRGPIQIKGEINSSQLELSQLPGLRSRMSGRLDAKTELSGQASQLQQLPATVQSSTAFNVQAAVIKGVDLAKAVKTLGMSRDGQTPLSRLSGQLSTRGLGPSMLITLSALQASSSLLNASGGVQVGAASGPAGARPLSGKINVDLNAPDAGTGAGKALGALVGIPLEISGTTAAPQVQPSRGAMIGGTIGSVMAPVIGTGAGAKMGDRVGEKLSGLKEKLFGK
jgi:hypothetical protein